MRLLPSLLGLTIISLFFGCRSYSSRLTVANIIAVRPGMTMEQVAAILGEPIRKQSVGEVNFYCPCNPEKRCTEKSYFTFTYTQRRKVPWAYPMLWVHFNERRHVRSVYVKKYEMDEDREVYWARQNPCDPTDPIVPLSDADSAHVRALGELFDE